MDISYKQRKESLEGHVMGTVFTVIVHVLMLFILGVTGFRLIYPPPEEKGILLEIAPDEIKLPPMGQEEPQGPVIQEDVRLVQQSEAPTVADVNKAGKATTIDDYGDVEKYEPKRKEAINTKALFTSADNRSAEEAEQTAAKVSEALRAGQARGNTDQRSLEKEPSVRLEGRSLTGNLPKPDYTVNKSGMVVVKIVVDQNGIVTNALPGQSGTTVTDATLWDAAKRAALKARFSVDSNAPAKQIGTITYVFTLK